MIQETKVQFAVLPHTSKFPADNDTVLIHDGEAAFGGGLYLIASLLSIALFLCITCILGWHASLRSGESRRKPTVAFTRDAPPRYSEVIPPTYEWAVKHTHHPLHILTLKVDQIDDDVQQQQQRSNA
ncbi:hypothetical protein Tcan_15619 [Toxocara canis]|uniref:Uncharacterized protein n=1 Tax=Toxocara canis TaxID=6265 RepID=A0A0B2VHN7_TOXCA|nr:hypothetical protein Tcan_15619 [Toxocara canis]